jgi:hypothetical protein
MFKPGNAAQRPQSNGNDRILKPNPDVTRLASSSKVGDSAPKPASIEKQQFARFEHNRAAKQGK